MSKTPIALDSLSDTQLKAFRRLTSAPPLNVRVATLWGFVMVTYLGAVMLALWGAIPLWVATISNALVGYFAFTVGHDGIHRSISTNEAVNDFMAATGIMLVAPYVDIKLFRWAHILHHRFTGGDRDPDRMLDGAWYTLPFRWMFIDAVYFIYAFRHGDKVSQKHMKRAVPRALAVLALMVGLIAFGYGAELLMLWFIPSRMIFLMLGFSFFWLPHVPHDTAQQDNFTRATTIRQGHENLMGVMLQNQHYHLIHHLYPTTPSSNNRKVYELIKADLHKNDLAIQHGFSIHPTIHPAP